LLLARERLVSLGRQAPSNSSILSIPIFCIINSHKPKPTHLYSLVPDRGSGADRPDSARLSTVVLLLSQGFSSREVHLPPLRFHRPAKIVEPANGSGLCSSETDQAINPAKRMAHHRDASVALLRTTSSTAQLGNHGTEKGFFGTLRFSTPGQMDLDPSETLGV